MPQYYDRDNKSNYNKKRYQMKKLDIKPEIKKIEMINKKVILLFN